MAFDNIYILSTKINLFIPQGTKDVFVMSWVANKLSFEESNVNNGRVEVDELEDENFKSKVVIIF